MKYFYIILLFPLTFLACKDTAQPTSVAEIHGQTKESDVLEHPSWSKNATIYEVNIRQHTPSGTFAAFEKDIPRIREMGIDILWLMPVFPIGEKNRKGGLGSYYSIRDYYAVNPEFGKFEDLIRIVNTAHSFGMKVILDWVPNHTAWDCTWIKSHPEYYSLNEEGAMHPPVDDWSDVVDLNYDNEGLRTEMIAAMKFWLEEADVDGFRCDVAYMVPIDFWERARRELELVNPDLFMLAEAELPDHHQKAFDMSYTWEMMHVMNGIAKGEMTFTDLDKYMAKEDTNFVRDAYRMTFTTNHDENSWNGTVFDRYGPAHKLFAVLAFTIQGMPLVYSGQEAGNTESLKFFEKDTIVWGNYELQEFYSQLLKVNKNEKALWNGMYGGRYTPVKTSNPDVIFAFTRSVEGSEVFVVVNNSDTSQPIKLEDEIEGEFESIFDGQILTKHNKHNLALPAWGYQIFVK